VVDSGQAWAVQMPVPLVPDGHFLFRGSADGVAGPRAPSPVTVLSTVRRGSFLVAIVEGWKARASLSLVARDHHNHGLCETGYNRIGFVFQGSAPDTADCRADRKISQQGSWDTGRPETVHRDG
jgi:hypothetical protein